MSCERVRRVVLAAERPEPPPMDVRPHLGECRECRGWLRRLGNMERQLALLPVPPSDGKERLLQQLRDRGAERRPLSNPSIPLPVQLKERGLRKLSVAFALAATVAAFAVGLWLWPHQGVRLPDPGTGLDFEASWEAQRIKGVAGARTPAEHVKGITAFAIKLQEEAADLAQRAEAPRLDALARYYDHLICQDLVEMAGIVPSDERPALFREVRGMLGRAESEMERLAAQWHGSAASLRQIAGTAREGDRRLRALLQA